MKMGRRLLAALAVLSPGALLPGALSLVAQVPAQTPVQSSVPGSGSAVATETLPPGTPLAVAIERPAPLHVGQRLQAHLLYDVWQTETKVLPAGTAVEGKVIALVPDRPHRLQSRLRADFTPFSRPEVRFDTIVLPDGTRLPVSTSRAAEGAPVVRLTPPPPATGGYLKQGTRMVKQMARDRIAVVTGPDKKDRLVQYLYTQLPYHPQRIDPKTAWTVETTAALTVPLAAPAVAAATTHPKMPDEQSAAPLRLEANLKEALSSKETHQGQAIRAIVAQPAYNADGSLAVPEGAVLEGAVTQVRPARRWGRAGALRFDFRQLQLPEATGTQAVRTSLAGVDAPGGSTLMLNSEGEVKPKPKDKVAVPLLLFALASRPLDRDGGDGGFGKNAVASNSLGLIGFLVGTAGGWSNVAAGIGYYGTALSVWNRWIKRGEETTFLRDTRVIVETTARRSTPLRPSTP